MRVVMLVDEMELGSAAFRDARGAVEAGNEVICLCLASSRVGTASHGWIEGVKIERLSVDAPPYLFEPRRNEAYFGALSKYRRFFPGLRKWIDRRFGADRRANEWMLARRAAEFASACDGLAGHRDISRGELTPLGRLTVHQLLFYRPEALWVYDLSWLDGAIQAAAALGCGVDRRLLAS